ncbi:MAG: HAD-IA family hydrolase [Gemmatimonadales bacterium]
MPSIRTVLFDLDGTLIDSIDLILSSYRHTMSAHGFPEVPDSVWLEGVGTPLRAQLGPWASETLTLETLVATYRDYNLSNHDQMVRPFPHLSGIVRAIRARGYRTGVVTSKTREGTRRGLTLVGLEDAIEIMVCADDVTNAKPHPEPVEKAVAALGADPKTTIYIGDSIHDLHSGRAAGVLTGAVLWGPFSRATLEPAAPDYWLETPQHLERLLLT